jgi:hypothetical protein|uniref:Ragulator complex protein LAMTOR1 n=1 Tax=Panagrolaimus davidi TaxID=227884 RepID=A0A914P2X8_9BILA
MSFLYKLCCGWCGSEENDDVQPLIIPEPNLPIVYPLPNPGGLSHPSVSDSDHNTPPVHPPPKSREQVEQEMLEKILDRTQQRIIDVSNYNDYYNPDVDVAERSQKYQSLIAKHDDGKCEALPVCLLLENVGMDLPDVMQRIPLDDEDINILRQWNKGCLAACRIGLQIEKRDDIVVHMNTDDN